MTLPGKQVPPPGGLADLAGRPVARIGYGAIQLEHGDDATAQTLLRRAVELGVNHLDTAAFYGAGRVNARIRAALSPFPDGLVLATKVGATSAPGEPHGLRPAQRPEEIRAEVETNLRELGVERLGVVNLFPMSRSEEIPVSGDQRVALDDQLAVLVELRDADVIGGIGLSHVDVATLHDCLPAGIVCVQNGFNVLDRTSEPVRAACAHHGVAWAPYSPLGPGGASALAEQPLVRSVAADHGVTPAQIGLAWILALGPDTLAIPGTQSLAHLEQNLAAGNVVIDPAARARLDDLA